MESYVTLTGRTVEFEHPTGKLAAFMNRLRTAADEPKTTEADMILLLYGKDNPLLNPNVFAEMGAVTPEVINNPIYHVMVDLLARKRVQAGTLDLAAAEARCTLSVSDAATRLGVHPSAIRQAIDARKLPAWKKGGRYYLDPRSVDSYSVGNRGPARKPAARSRSLRRAGRASVR